MLHTVDVLQERTMSNQFPPDAGIEAHFEFKELFFSRTDANGIIKIGNSVFQRVSVYSFEELIGAPHKIVRHPDMPRAVFKLLWQTIKQGAPIGAYVKNRAKDGRYYWVFAIVTPIDGGYLSVRLRPSSPLLDVIKQEYAALAARERQEQLTPDQSADLLLQRLDELGYQSYSAFMATALSQEMAARDAHISAPLDTSLEKFITLQKTARSLLTRADEILNAYTSNEHVPLNFRVLAAQLGRNGAAIGVISANYSLLSDEMRVILNQFIGAARAVLQTIEDGQFLLCTARVQRDLVEFFKREASAASEETAGELALLDRQRADYRSFAVGGLTDIARNAESFHRACMEMNRLAAGLEVTRVLSMVECAQHAAMKHQTAELLGELALFQRTVAAALKEIDRMNQTIRSETNSLISQVSRQAA